MSIDECLKPHAFVSLYLQSLSINEGIIDYAILVSIVLLGVVRAIAIHVYNDIFMKSIVYQIYYSNTSLVIFTLSIWLLKTINAGIICSRIIFDIKLKNIH